MFKIFVSKSIFDIRTLSSITAIMAFSLLAGCQTLTTNNMDQTPADMRASNPLTARMPAIDRQGRIAYVEEQGKGQYPLDVPVMDADGVHCADVHIVFYLMPKP